MKQTKGISMISLVITVLVIAILAAVMIPSGIDKINSAKLTSFSENILTLKQEANTYLMQNNEYPVKLDGSGNPVVYSISSNASLVTEATKKNDQNDTFYIIDLDKVKLDNKDNGVGKSIDDFYILAKTSGNVYYAKGQKIGNVTYYTKQNKGDGVIAAVPSGAPVPNGAFDGKVNAPKLATGMTAIKWNGSAWVNADATNANNDWYDYTVGVNKWANVKLADGSMLVWIPRYTYKIISGEHTSTAGVIDVKFSMGAVDDTTDSYRIHPAFYWGGWNIPANALMSKQPGGTEITGIWVGKFESSAANGLQDTNGDKVKIVPNVASWRNLKVGDIFDKSRQMQTANSATYGISNDSSIIDTHMMKNSEWGAVVYICKYARGATEVTINDNSSYLVGKGDYINNYNLSTTGNIYGIYDMSGGSWEYVPCYINNSNGNLNTYGGSIVSSTNKYKDILPLAGTDLNTNNYNLIDKAYGHAFWESSATGNATEGWFGDFGYFMEVNGPFAARGSNYSGGSSGGVFAFSTTTGFPYVDCTWRIGITIP